MEDIEIVEEEVEEKIPESGKQIWEAYLILEDIPKVMDERLREYGPFKAGDLVTLPRTLGHVLVQREAARRVSISH
jgi:DNA replication factor GINS